MAVHPLQSEARDGGRFVLGVVHADFDVAGLEGLDDVFQTRKIRVLRQRHLDRLVVYRGALEAFRQLVEANAAEIRVLRDRAELPRDVDQSSFEQTRLRDTAGNDVVDGPRG